jgi:hypothetical protein
LRWTFCNTWLTFSCLGSSGAIDPFGVSVENYDMSPTVFRHGPYRFYFFSREEARMHVHVQSSAGEAKFWLEPDIVLAQNYGLSTRHVNTALRLIKEHEDEIREAWQTHFGR